MEGHILSVLVQNNAGVLSRISQLFGRRAYNIDSLTVSPTNDPKISRITMVTLGEEQILEQIMKQVSKMEEVIDVVHLKEEECFIKESLILRIAIDRFIRDNVLELVEVYGASVLQQTEDYLVIELSDIPSHISSFLHVANNYNILEMSRTGITAMPKTY